MPLSLNPTKWRTLPKLYSSPDWHNCDGSVGQWLRYIPRPGEEWNDGFSSYAFALRDGRDGKIVYLPIKFCPVCGIELMEEK